VLEAVTFDYWNTLVWEEPGGLQEGRVAAWMGIFEEAGLEIAQARLDEAHERAFGLASASWVAGRQYTAEHAGAEVVRVLGLEVPEAVLQRVVDAFSDAGRQTTLHVTVGLEEALQRLRSAGMRLGIVCDVGLTPSPVLLDHLVERDLMQYFDAWVFSDTIGTYKPARAPFEEVLASLGGIDPARVAHTGDRRRTDVAGARAMGMVSVRYTAVFDDESDLPEADHVVSSHAEMLDALGVQAAPPH
jgi:HAD superfamily hydrolase (TIGR01549 family)